jgi:uncharacterized protein (TIGR00661 family)
LQWEKTAMKILYAVQASGNGHIARANELIPYLEKYGEVDTFLSGNNHALPLNNIRFRSHGFSLIYNRSGGIHYPRSIRQIKPVGLFREVTSLPVHQYDIVLNDFDFITSKACLWHNISSMGFGHHASFQSDSIPLPAEKSRIGDFLLKHWASATSYTGLHFMPYDNFIYNPVVRQSVLDAMPVNSGHITIYLPACGDRFLLKHLNGLKGLRFEIFSSEVKSRVVQGQFTFYPADTESFTQSMICSAGVITSGGFETPAEAMALGKKLMVIPICGQYEQSYNIAALTAMGVRCLKKIEPGFRLTVSEWMESDTPVEVNYRNHIPALLEHIMNTYPFGAKAFPVPQQISRFPAG